MRVYAFAEYYPNPFKPYVDTQLAQTVMDGHDLSIFAFGTWGDVGSRAIAAFHLDRRTRYLPARLEHLGRYGLRTVGGVMRRGPQVLRALAASESLVRRRVFNAAQAALLPAQPPDLCMIHDLGTAVRLTALRAVYPSTRVAIYFHGGEVAPGMVSDEAVARRGFGLADLIFTNTEFSRGQAVARGCPPARVHVVPVGFDLAQFAFTPERPPRSPLRLAIIGRLAPEKGIRHALDALALVSATGLDTHCTIVGDGDDRATLEAQVDRLGLRHVVRFAGPLPYHEVTRVLSEAHAVLLPSVPQGTTWAETQACVLQEAMLTGTMLVASRLGGVPESVPDDMHEFLVVPGDAPAIAKAVRRLAALPEAEWLARARANRAFCEARYDIRVLNRRMFEDVTRTPRTPTSAGAG